MNSFELSHFRARRHAISVQIALLAQIARDLNTVSVASELAKTNDDMEAEVFRFVVVGEFSRGKSTVINALLGDRVLPSSVEPTTAVLTKIVGGQCNAFRLIHRGDRPVIEITRDQFGALVAPPEPGRGAGQQRQQYEERLTELRSLSMIEVTCSASICDAGVEIIDTPGTNDLDPLREQITYDYIPRADAILFVLTARMGLSQSESDFLQNRVLKTDVARIFFLLNYADTLTPSDLNTVEKKCVSDLSTFVEQPRLFPVSAKRALASRIGSSNAPSHSVDDGGFPELEQALASFLEKDRAGAKLKRPISRALRTCEELLAGPLAIARSTIGMQLPILQQKIEELSPKIQQLQRRRDLTLAALRLRLDNRRSSLVILMREGLYEVANAALEAVDKYDGPLGTDELGRHIEARVAPVQSRFQSSFKSAASEAFSEEFSKVGNDLARIQEDFDALFAASSVSAGFQYEVPSLSGTGWKLLQAGGAGAGFLFLPFLFAPIALLVGWLGGAFIGDLWQTGVRREKQGEIRNAVDERYRGTIPASVIQFENNWQDAVQHAIAELTRVFDQRCDDARAALQTALEKFSTESATAAEMRAKMDAIESRVRSVQKNLAKEEISL